MRQVHARCITCLLAGIEPERICGFQLHLATRKGAYAQFWALQVDKDRRRAVIGFFERTDIRDQLRFFGLFAMAHVDAKGIRPCTEQLFDHFRRVARGTQCREDTDLAHARLVILHLGRLFRALDFVSRASHNGLER